MSSVRSTVGWRGCARDEDDPPDEEGELVVQVGRRNTGSKLWPLTRPPLRWDGGWEAAAAAAVDDSRVQSAGLELEARSTEEEKAAAVAGS